MRYFCLFIALICLLAGTAYPNAVCKRPYGGSAAVYCDPGVVKAFSGIWSADANGMANMGTKEYGFRIDWIDGKLVPGPIIMGDKDYQVDIPVSEDTIAIAHTHPNGGISSPSGIDLKGEYPDYVISRDGLFVTDPKTQTYRLVRSYTDQFRSDICPAPTKPKKSKKGKPSSDPSERF